MKKVSVLVLIALFAISCDSASDNNSSDSTVVVPVFVDTTTPSPVGADTLVNLAGDTIIREIQK